MSEFYALGRCGERDIDKAVRLGTLPRSALFVERVRAMIEIPTLHAAWLEFLAYGNEDPGYGAVCRGELARRAKMEAEAAQRRGPER